MLQLVDAVKRVEQVSQSSLTKGVGQMTLYGYMRVSTMRQKQALKLQKDALLAAGCVEENIFQDIGTGRKASRTGLNALLATIQAGDIVHVWKVDRIMRSFKHLNNLMDIFQAKKVDFKSLTQQFDTTSSTGKVLFGIIGLMAEFEADLIRERVVAGLEAARSRGSRFGRPPLKVDERVLAARSMHGTMPNKQLCAILKISKATLYRWLEVEEESA